MKTEGSSPGEIVYVVISPGERFELGFQVSSQIKRVMKILTDCFGRQVRLTDERLAHILERPELSDLESEIEEVLSVPRFVRASRSDNTVRLFYGFYSETLVGGKWLCVVVKYDEADAFVVTAYLTKQTEGWRRLMAEKLKVWFDPAADYLEVHFKEAPGYMKETAHDAVMERVDAEGKVIGFSILGVSRFTKEKPLEAELTAA